jgi:hypothetical protein
MPKAKVISTRGTGKTIDDASRLLERGSAKSYQLMSFGVVLLRELCETKGLLVVSTGKRGAIKQDYVKALLALVSVVCMDHRYRTADHQSNEQSKSSPSTITSGVLVHAENVEHKDKRTSSPIAGPNCSYAEDIEMDHVGGDVEMGHQERNLKVDHVKSNPSELAATSICVRLYAERRGRNHIREINFQREPNGDLNLVLLAKMLQVEGTVRVSSPL